MVENAKKLAAVFERAADATHLEKPFREAVEKHLVDLGVKLGIEMTPHTEVTMGTSGRADTIYNRFIVEWEAPGSLKASNSATKNRETIAQVQRYGDSLYWRTREKAGRIVGCCTDGRYFIFLTKPERIWTANNPVVVDTQSCRKFLDYFESLHSGIALLPDYLSQDFSAENFRTQRTVRALYESLLAHSSAPSLDAIFGQWAQFFASVTEYEQWRVKLANEASLRKMLKAFGISADKPDLNRFFFATHTFFAILTKLLAYIIVGRYTDLPTPPLTDWPKASNEELAARFKELEHGGPFHAAGIRNFLEGDFFAWYTRYFTPELGNCLREVVKRLADYDPATLDLAPAPTQDLLKKIYHRLVSPHIRKALGEYYTPDWLAQRVLNMLEGGKFRGDPETRLLDPACGSGTFLVMAINAIRDNSMAQSMDESELLRRICHNIVGIDLNPLAVIAARTNYLMALGPLLKHRGKELLDIPIYLADSIMTPSRKDYDLFEQERVRVWLNIGKVEVPRRLATQEGIATLTHLLDKHLEATPSSKPDKFIRDAKPSLIASYDKEKLEQEKLAPEKAWQEDGELLRKLYETLFELHDQGRNGMWARIIKNAFAPVFLAPFDYVAGNPPWINWENLPEGYRKETKSLWFDHGLFVHKGMDTILGKGKKDISMLLTYVAADSYLKDGGKLGFVITQTVFKTSGAGQGFRKFVTRSKRPIGVIWLDDFSEMQLFEGATNRTAVFIMRKGHQIKYPVQSAYWRKLAAGRKGSFGYDTKLEEVTAKTQRFRFVADPVSEKDKTSSWLTGPPAALRVMKKLLGKSDYEAHEGVNTGGANAVYWFDILNENRDGTVYARNITEGAKRKIESVRVRLENDLLYPLIRGRDSARWAATPAAHILFVQDVKKRHGILEDELKKDYPLTYQWLDSNRATLLKRSSQAVRNLMKKSVFSIFGVGDYSLAPWKVLWSEVSNQLNASVVGRTKGKPTLVDHTVVEVALYDQGEAYFVAGVLNSTLFRFAVARYIALHPDPHILDNIRVPKFDSRSKLHQAIAKESRRLSSGVEDAGDPINAELDTLCSSLWDVTSKELETVEGAYRELYVRAPAATIVKEEVETEAARE